MIDLNGYVFDGTIDLGEESGACGNCGKTLRYGVWLKHLLTGNRILVGRKCSDRAKGIICKNCGTELHKLVKAPQGIRCMFCGKNPIDGSC